MGYGAEGGELERSGHLPAVPRAVMEGALAPMLSSTKPRRARLRNRTGNLLITNQVLCQLS